MSTTDKVEGIKHVNKRVYAYVCTCMCVRVCVCDHPTSGGTNL